MMCNITLLKTPKTAPYFLWMRKEGMGLGETNSKYAELFRYETQEGFRDLKKAMYSSMLIIHALFKA